MSPLQDSHPASQDDPPVLDESEAMRRMQDLLKAGKVSTSDTVVFEYNHHFFAAQIMPDGSLRSKPQQSDQHPSASPHLKLYRSPSEFASDMAACALLLDEKVTRPRGKVSFNGWNNCTVNGRTLAMIRNEMLHERKNESANVSKEKAKVPVVTTVGVAPLEPGESSRSAAAHAEHISTYGNPSSQDSPNQAELNPKNIKDPCTPSDEEKKHNPSTSREEETRDKLIHPDFLRNDDGLRKVHAGTGSDKALNSSAHETKPNSADVGIHEVKPQEDKTKGGSSKRDGPFVVETQSLDGSPVKNLASDHREPTGVIRKPHSEDDLHEVPGRTVRNLDDEEDPVSGKRSDTNLEPTNQKLECAEEETEIPSYPKTAEHTSSKNNTNRKKEKDTIDDPTEQMDIDATAIPSPEKPYQSEAQGTGEQVTNSDQAEEVQDQIGDDAYDNISPSNDRKYAMGRVKDTPQLSDDDHRRGEERIISSNLVESKESGLRDSTSPQPVSSEFRSLKEVSDLQQEILGDSDSDEESFIEDERKAGSVLKKRSRSPPIYANKRKRTGESRSPETDRGPLTRLVQQGSSEGNNQDARMETTMGSEIEVAQLDPETMEAAAIAAQIEKEEASNRARRTTRLRAGKIKQVDYKASAVAQAPRSVSPGHGSEDNDRNSNDNESPTDATRTTRRRSTPIHLYPPQRSSRRVAKLKNSQEKEHSSNDEMDSRAPRSSSGGNGNESRSDKEGVDIEDIEAGKSQGFRPNGTRSDSNDRRRGRIDSSVKRTRQVFQDEGDHDSQGRAYSTRASTRENSVVDAADITELGDPNDFPSESEDVEDEEDIGDRSNGHGFTTGDLNIIAQAVKACGSADPASVLEALGELDAWKADDVKNQIVQAFLNEVIERVQNLSESLGRTSEEVGTAQVLSYLSAEVWRLNTGGLVTGIPRKPIAVLRKATKEDQLRCSLERSRRKEHRDLEEMRAALERDMELRRRAELDTLYVDIQVSEAMRALSREKARCYRVEHETEKYRDMEANIRKRLEKAKILVGQLRGEKDDSDGGNGNIKKDLHQDDTLRIESRPNGSFATKTAVGARHSSTSDDDVEMTDKNITTTSQRLLEMDRLRVLIAAREAEAEEFQRICEKERMRFVSALELKNRLETEIYLYRSHGAVAYGGGGSSVLAPSSRIVKENPKKGDIRGASAYGNRGVGYVRQKSGAGAGAGTSTSIGKTGASVAPVTTVKSNAASNKPKPVSAKGGEAAKLAKRKPILKNGSGGNGSDKM